MELQSDAKHDQNHAHFGELFRYGRVGGKARRVRPNEHARDQIADDGREPQPLRGITEDERRAESGGKHQDQVRTVHAETSYS